MNQDAPENEEIKGLSAWRDKLIRLDDLISKQDGYRREGNKDGKGNPMSEAKDILSLIICIFGCVHGERTFCGWSVRHSPQAMEEQNITSRRGRLAKRHRQKADDEP